MQIGLGIGKSVSTRCAGGKVLRSSLFGLSGEGILPPQCILYIFCGLEYPQYPVSSHRRRLVVNSLETAFSVSGEYQC